MKTFPNTHRALADFLIKSSQKFFDMEYHNIHLAYEKPDTEKD